VAAVEERARNLVASAKDCAAHSAQEEASKTGFAAVARQASHLLNCSSHLTEFGTKYPDN
jgi:hypothetical protein